MRFLLIILILLTVSACAPQQATSIPPAPVCNCPTGMLASTPTQDGAIGPALVVCSCPAIIVQPPVSATEVGSTPQEIPTHGIALVDNGKTFFAHPGDRFLLNLGIDFYDWAVEIDNQNVLSRVKNVTVLHGAQGIYAANSPGQALLTATGDPFCRKSIPACEAPALLFRITVIVQ
jgi:hypothetical protein